MNSSVHDATTVTHMVIAVNARTLAMTFPRASANGLVWFEFSLMMFPFLNMTNSYACQDSNLFHIVISDTGPTKDPPGASCHMIPDLVSVSMKILHFLFTACPESVSMR